MLLANTSLICICWSENLFSKVHSTVYLSVNKDESINASLPTTYNYGKTIMYHYLLQCLWSFNMNILSSLFLCYLSTTFKLPLTLTVLQYNSMPVFQNGSYSSDWLVSTILATFMLLILFRKTTFLSFYTEISSSASENM